MSDIWLGNHNALVAALTLPLLISTTSALLSALSMSKDEYPYQNDPWLSLFIPLQADIYILYTPRT